MFRFVQTTLLADAEVLEDVAEDFVGGDLAAGDFAQSGDAGVKVLGNEVAWELLVHSVDGTTDGEEGFVEHLLVADVCDEKAVLGDGWYGCQELFVKPGKTGAVDGLELGRLIADADDRLVGTYLDVGVGYTWLGHKDKDVGTGGSRKGTLNAHTLDGVGGGADTRRIKETEGDALQLEGVLDDVARGALYVRYNGLVIAYECVEQGRFAHIGCSEDGYGDAVADGIARGKGGGEFGYFAFDTGGKGEQLGTVGKLHILLTEVEFEFEERGDMKELLAQVGKTMAHDTSHLRHRHTMAGSVGGGDKVGHGFGLREVHLAIEESTLGELARACHLASFVQKELQNAVEDVARTMAGNFHAVLARIGMWGTEERDKHFVDNFPMVDDTSKMQGITLTI